MTLATAARKIAPHGPGGLASLGAEPDPTGTQYAALRKRREHLKIELIWIDYSSMPQGERNGEEAKEFKRMLPNITKALRFRRTC